MTPLVDSLFAIAEARPEREAFLAEAGAVSYGVSARMIAAGASRLRRAGISRGDRVALRGANSPELAAAHFAIHAAGGVATPFEAEIPAEAARWIVADSGASLALAARELDLPVPTRSLLDWLRAEDGVFPDPPRCVLEDAADLLYTSGTTGRKKGVLLTHARSAQAAANINAFLQTEADDVRTCARPPEPLLRPRAVAVHGANGRCARARGGDAKPGQDPQTPARLRSHRPGDGPRGLRFAPANDQGPAGGRSGAAALRRNRQRAMRLDLKRKLMELLPQTRICHHYGLSEASRAAFLEYHADRHKLDSIGRPSPNVEIAVRDAQGRDVPTGQRGELAVRGGMVMKEYWRQPDLTRRTLRDGWLYTGDWGSRDADGYLHLVGRRTDLVNVGGRKVSPEEVECLLNAHPAVVESACVAAADPQGITGDCVKACIVVRANVADQELVEWLRGRLEEYKIPRIWERVDAIAKTASGKIQRGLMQSPRGEAP